MIELVSANGTSKAIVNLRGAGLSEWWVNGRQVVGAPDVYSGVMLFPWPNRILGATWSFEGRNMRLPVNEPATNSSLHGLVFDQNFSLVSEDPVTCETELRLQPSSGYPFSISLSARFQLKEDSISITYGVTNTGVDKAPFAIGFHPYFVAHENSMFSCAVRQFELAEVQIDETLGPNLHSAVLDLGEMRVQLDSPDHEYIHVFTNRYRTSEHIWFAMEPQSSPADSLNTGRGVYVLNSSESKEFNYQLVVS
jgi:aldose 1-epimerase